MMTLYNGYVDEIKDDITTCLENMNAQPILFIGSGLSKRYFNAPNWEEMLIELASVCPKIDKKFAYYKQMCKNNIEIGQMFSELFREWAWTDGINDFEEKLFEASCPSDIYIKHQIKKILEAITPKTINDISNKHYLKEIELLKEIKPHAIITTNYDQFLEVLFPEYTPIVGQKLLKSDVMSIGEIYKIHGCITDPESLVFNEKDYENFTLKKKYLSAKLLTYFAEHPLLFIGYNAEDPNIKSILSDIDEIISPENDLIPNIYILEWSKDDKFSTLPAKERLISINNNRSIRIKSICSHDFEWVYETFGKQSIINNVNPKLLRMLLARTYELIRCDIPKNRVEVDYQILEEVATNESGLAKLYGITSINDPKQINAAYPFSLTDIANELGYKNWYNANLLLEKIRSEKNEDIKASDNRYHIAIKAGERVTTRKYSKRLVELLKRVRDGEDYYIKLDMPIKEND